MKDKKLWKLVQAALFAALTCVATMVVHIPVPATGGYLNLGDAVVLLGALMLGPWYGFAAGGLGSMLADLLSGYPQYAPGTLVIKGLCAVVAVLLWSALENRLHWKPLPALLVGTVAGEAVMVLGYFAYEGLILGYGLGAAAAILGNVVQGAAGIVLSILLFWQLRRLKPYFNASH